MILALACNYGCSGYDHCSPRPSSAHVQENTIVITSTPPHSTPPPNSGPGSWDGQGPITGAETNVQIVGNPPFEPFSSLRKGTRVRFLGHLRRDVRRCGPNRWPGGALLGGLTPGNPNHRGFIHGKNGWGNRQKKLTARTKTLLPWSKIIFLEARSSECRETFMMG